ncbi:flagellar basal body L-ring protein FlgH [Aquabacterium sp. A7-Y]|uniref:flagellar basal body L-ring protein FlgH n=1 Tax=Aquabacterium sp. A7-Y TaxID=1349605 RepID=UPI00223D1715|nr:flagellar basal body L-ring protein FlgH [Aquabacterium sp. A7-Y]MCW7540509.1 flagellar basal body L-ring protein FlgH [Aquabacterium sp. A7-Y]
MYTALRPAALAVAVLATGCASMDPKVEVVQPTTARPAPVAVAAAPAPANGSIFQAAGYRPLFEDHRARVVGDSITVNIVERVQASQKSSTTVDKQGSVEAGITALPFLSPNSFNRASADASGSNTFAGKGGTESTNNFTGTITATVIEVLPNGHLVIAGEKQIGLNKNVEIMRFSGRIDPRAIQSGNSVASSQIADARLQYKGRGQQAEAQGIGWLGRFFLNVLPL